MIQFGRALNALNIEIICANSGQAKGRVERAHRSGILSGISPLHDSGQPLCAGSTGGYRLAGEGHRSGRLTN
jgi:hypothetical protein